MGADAEPVADELRAYLKDLRAYYLDRQRKIKERVQEFYFNEAKRLVKLAYSEDDWEQIRGWLYNRKSDFLPNSDNSSEDAQAQQNRENFHEFLELKYLACFFILAPMTCRPMSLAKTADGFSEYDRLFYDHNALLELELQSIQNIHLIYKLYTEKMADHVFAKNFEEAEEGLQKFMMEKGSKAERVAIFFIGHGKEEGGTMVFDKDSAENKKLVNLVNKHKRDYCIPGAVESFWLVFAQCYGHDGLEALKDEIQKEHAEGGAQTDCIDNTKGMLRLHALASDDKPKVSTKVEWYDYKETSLQLDEPPKPPTKVLTGVPEFARRPLLEKWIRTHLIPTVDEDDYQEFITECMESLSMSDEDK